MKCALKGCVLLLGLALIPAAPAQSQDDATEDAGTERPIDEVIAVGRLKSSQFDVIQERIDQEVVADFLGAEQISRTGDSTVSLALRRMPGITLVNDEFVYVRGLGERYSSTLLNGAHVPSPDLTRNVIPLDIFPTSIVEGLAVQKVYSANMPAAFGGGNVNIMTRSIPSGPVFSWQIGSGWNSESDSRGYAYPGGGRDWRGSDDGTRAMPGEIGAAIQEYLGDITTSGILRGLARDGQSHAPGEAAAINRELATSLYRDTEVSDKSLSPDVDLDLALGNSWYLGESERWEFGTLGIASYGSGWRNRERRLRSVLNPDTQFSDSLRTTHQVSLTGALNFGLRFTDDHLLNLSNLYLRNTDDDTSINFRHTSNFLLQDGRRLRDYRIRYEERELRSSQIRGRHTVGPETAEMLPILDRPWLEGVAYEWYYSDSTATTDIPSEILVAAEDIFDPATGDIIETRVRRSNSALEYRFTDLEDDVESYGWSLSKPITSRNFDIVVSGGQDYVRKSRQYLQTQLNLGTTEAAALPILLGTPGEVFTDANILDPANGFALSIGGIGTESYLAGEIIDAAFFKVDTMVGDRWRITTGLRWEQFSRATLPIDPLDFSVNPGQSRIPPERLEDAIVIEDEFYPAVALTYILPGFWAETFQLRFGASETVVRPDLREVSPATFIDPLTEARVQGRPSLKTSPMRNYDVRAEWFFANGDNFTLSLFYKDIENPIETAEAASSDDNLALTFINTESAELYGLEIDWLKDMGFLSNTLGGWTEYFFVAGNLTLSESELTVGVVPVSLTNDRRPMNQHSKRVANLQIGFDSPGGEHNWTLAYNTFSERLYYAGRGGAPDAFQQPFDSLDFIYSFYPTDRTTVKLKLQNILDDSIEIRQGDTTVLEQKLGSAAKLQLDWNF